MGLWLRIKKEKPWNTRVKKLFLPRVDALQTLNYMKNCINVPLYCQIAYPQSQGMGLLLGQSVGGYLRGGEKYSPLYGMILADEKYPSPMFAVVKKLNREIALGNPSQL